MATYVECTCEQCGKRFERLLGQYRYHNLKNGNRLMCSRDCWVESHKLHKAAHQKKAEKAEYDKEYRAREEVRAKRRVKANAFWKTPAGKAKRKARMSKHLEYCRQPEYREKKKEYDQRYRAEQMYGEFAEAYLALLQIDTEVESRIDRQEIRAQNGTLNKSQERKREYARTFSNQFEERTLGDIERD